MKLAWKDAFSLALLPGAIALAVTLLRLAGELGHWSDTWFVRTTGGLVPSSAVGWIAGITWLALPFGCYFSWRLVRRGDRPGHRLARSCSPWSRCSCSTRARA